MLSELIGALMLSRALAAADPALSTEILAANRRKPRRLNTRRGERVFQEPVRMSTKELDRASA
jgi:hypothetical protein